MASDPTRAGGDSGTGPLRADDSGYKYDTEYSQHSDEWHWRNTHGRPRITGHAQEQYDDRTPAEAVAPETAWCRGRDVSVLASADEFIDKDGAGVERLRLYHGYDGGEHYTVIFLVTGLGTTGSIPTVYRLNRIADPAVKAYLNAVAIQFESHSQGRGE